MKRNAIYILPVTILLLFTMSMTGFAATSGSSNLEKAVDLKILGLFNGTGNGFELELVPTRVEGAVMLLRLLGKEQEAKGLKMTHPFTDVPSWADSIIGYMYNKGLTTGTGVNTFGSAEQLTARQYVTFVLRALGYSDKNNDFKFENALDKAVETGLLSKSEASSLTSASNILRNDLAGISYNALKAKLKASSATLLDKLATQDKVISRTAAALLGLYTSDLKAEYGNVASYKPASTALGFVAKNSNDFFNIMKKSLYNYETQIKIDISSYSGNALDDCKAVLERAEAAASRVSGVKYFISKWEVGSRGGALTFTIGYRYSKAIYQTLKQQAADTLYKARHIVSGFISQGMPDYDKELFIHNYIVNNTRYDYESYLSGNVPEASSTAYGSLVLGKAVCGGYSEAFKLLADLSALESVIVEGESFGIGSRWQSHAWNIVKVGGKYYHVDTTFDDPVTNNGTDVLSYDYFNLPDKKISESHRWSRSEYPACNTTWLSAAN